MNRTAGVQGSPSIRPVIAMAMLGFLLSSGCVREAAQEATRGTLEALKRPTSRPAEPPQGEPPSAARPLIGSVVRDAVRSGARTLGSEAASLRPLMAEAGEAASSGVIQGAARHEEELVGLVVRGSGAAAKAIAREGAAELVEQLAPETGAAGEARRAPLPDGIALLAQRAAAGAVRGAAAQLGAELAACPGDDPRCPYATIERIGRAAAAGVGDGVGRALQPWLLGLAFAGGFLLAALGASVLALTRSRGRLPAR